MKIVLIVLLLSVIQNNDASFQIWEDELLQDIASEISLINIAKKSSILRDVINKDCMEDLADIIKFDKEWIWRMIDSAGKIPHGILRLNLNTIGQYRECIETSFKKPSGREITGRHCMLANTLTIPRPTLLDVPAYNFNPAALLIDAGIRNADFLERPLSSNENNNLSITINTGICFPSACSPLEINNILSIIPSESPLQLNITEATCSTQRTIELSPSNIGTISFLLLIGFIMLCSTLYDLWYQILKKGDKKEQKQLYIAFSVYTNSQRLFTPSKNPGPLACLHGIRVLSILWVMFGHRYAMTTLSPIENMLDFIEWFKNPSSAILGGASVSVDTFFFMSGILLGYVFFKSANMKNISRDLPMYYIHRILRLTPLLAVIILIHATLISLYGNGPYKYLSEFMTSVQCQKYWWTTLLYVQNYVGDNICIGQSWYLAVDMQLYIISPLILYPLLWNKKVGIVWISICIAAAQSVAFALAYTNEWTAGMFNRSESYFSKYYVPTHTRATPYFIGILTGYLLFHSFKTKNITTIQYNFSEENVVKQCLVIVGWLCSLTILGAVLFGSHPLNQLDHVFSHWEDTMYNAFSKTAWTLGLLWIIVACAYGYGGPINWFLSLRMWEILGRFSYALYLTHMTIQIILVANRNHVTVFNHINVIYDLFGDVVVSLAVSYVLILAFESPIAILEKIIFKRGKTNNSVRAKHEEKINGLPQEEIKADEKV